ncbi:MAG: signal peptidase II [Crocinitomicaceae bacterium]|nr:signal peptidase II [Crocinitomicaceae bacterium]
MAKKAALIVFGVLFLDQFVKIWIKTSFEPGETQAIVDGFIQLYYVENPGMAFGTTFGDGMWAKLALSIFRLVAITAITIYLRKIIKEGKMPMGFIIAISLVLAGAAGNLIDSMLYDYIFELDIHNRWNWVEDGAGGFLIGENGMPVTRPQGFLLASVVDMFQFTVKWPSWMPEGYAGNEIFGAIWNVADFAISTGVIWILVRYRYFFKKHSKDDEGQDGEVPSKAPTEEGNPIAESPALEQ